MWIEYYKCATHQVVRQYGASAYKDEHPYNRTPLLLCGAQRKGKHEPHVFIAAEKIELEQIKEAGSFEDAIRRRCEELQQQEAHA